MLQEFTYQDHNPLGAICTLYLYMLGLLGQLHSEIDYMKIRKMLAYLRRFRLNV